MKTMARDGVAIDGMTKNPAGRRGNPPGRERGTFARQSFDVDRQHERAAVQRVRRTLQSSK